MLCLGCAASGEARASDWPLQGEGLRILAALSGLWLCSVAVTLVVVVRRWRRQGPGALWSLLVPSKTLAVTAVGLNLIDGAGFSDRLDASAALALALCVELAAWAVAHLLQIATRDKPARDDDNR